jgi:hypothetical protein
MGGWVAGWLGRQLRLLRTLVDQPWRPTWMRTLGYFARPETGVLRPVPSCTLVGRQRYLLRRRVPPLRKFYDRRLWALRLADKYADRSRSLAKRDWAVCEEGYGAASAGNQPTSDC